MSNKIFHDWFITFHLKKKLFQPFLHPPLGAPDGHCPPPPGPATVSNPSWCSDVPSLTSDFEPQVGCCFEAEIRSVMVLIDSFLQYRGRSIGPVAEQPNCYNCLKSQQLNKLEWVMVEWARSETLRTTTISQSWSLTFLTYTFTSPAEFQTCGRRGYRGRGEGPGSGVARLSWMGGRCPDWGGD